MAKDLFTEIRVKYNTLSKNQKIVANYILENRDKCVRMTLNELGRECNLSETTIIRFINKLDYKSYQSFRLDMAQDLSRHDAADSPKGSEYQEIKSGDSAEEVKQKVISIASSAITDINNLIPVETVTEAAKLIESARKIMFFGAGGSGVVAMDVYHKFLRSGKNVIHEGNSHIALIHASQLTKDDLLILISHEGESKEVLECCRLAQEGKAKVLGITSYMNSDLAKMADLCIFSSTNDSAYYTEAMVSRLVQLVIMDMLFIIVNAREDDKALMAIEAANRATREMKVHNGYEEEA
ncbi:MurR/RpiR family transcriptional regulator [Anaerotignum faecicola]|nr:MurR/RpiR family transcriptional regulator [Anaerotignum faecicola]